MIRVCILLFLSLAWALGTAAEVKVLLTQTFLVLFGVELAFMDHG